MEIKYRAWDNFKNEWQDQAESGDFDFIDGLEIDYDKERFILEQYTPIKDICEGDKVYIAGLGVCTIIFDGLTFEAVTPKGDIVELRDCLEDIEKVIGNIHEEKS